jgi:hypothetical protein
MQKNLNLILFIILFAKAEMYAQSHHFLVNPAPFSSRINDEFSPVFYKGGIVMCSDQSENSLVSYKNEQNRLFKILYVTKRGSSGWSNPKILAKEITTDFNDGPVTFNGNGDILYYTRNNSIENHLRNISDNSNKLGIYSAELIKGIWTNIKPFRYNNPAYSFCTPSLTPNGDRIYFASDMPGGSGGMDLYYCDRNNNDWDQPVNLGPVVNTTKNESFPFASVYGKLFFSSDGLKGFGGKDLYYTQEINGNWINPVHLDSAINSKADDFGIVLDSTLENGYFSTNRRKTDDIFSFNSAPIEFKNCDTIKENNYCFTFYDERHQIIDTIPVVYNWDFGNGVIRTGMEVKHCFDGPGDYTVRLSIIDEFTGNIIAKQVIYKVKLENIEQAYINSSNVAIVNKLTAFEGNTADLKGFRITDYLWNFGDGFKPGGSAMYKSFKKNGEYIIRLGLLAEKDSLGIIPQKCFMKKIKVFDNYRELILKDEKTADMTSATIDSADRENKIMQTSFYLMDDLSEHQKMKISETLKGSGNFRVIFNRYGIAPASHQFLNKIVRLLSDNPDIRLETEVNSEKKEINRNEMTINQKCAQELSFYFKNEEISMDAFCSKSFGSTNQLFKPFISDGKPIDGIIEFIFLKN